MGRETYNETLTSATPMTNRDGHITGWKGAVYPNNSIEMMDIHKSDNIDNKKRVSAFTLGHRELIQIVVSFSGKKLSIFIKEAEVTNCAPSNQICMRPPLIVGGQVRFETRPFQ